jgi:hypothetical protein
MRSPDGRECSEFHHRPRIALSGKRTTKLFLLNPQERRVEQIQVDGCAITEGLRCDWLVILNDAIAQEEIYVELKGSGVHHAIEQLRTTVTQLSADCHNLRKRCLVVFTRNPMSGTDIQNQKVKFRKEFGALFSMVRDGAEVLL